MDSIEIEIATDAMSVTLRVPVDPEDESLSVDFGGAQPTTQPASELSQTQTDDEQADDYEQVYKITNPVIRGFESDDDRERGEIERGDGLYWVLSEIARHSPEGVTSTDIWEAADQEEAPYANKSSLGTGLLRLHEKGATRRERDGHSYRYWMHPHGWELLKERSESEHGDD